MATAKQTMPIKSLLFKNFIFYLQKFKAKIVIYPIDKKGAKAKLIIFAFCVTLKAAQNISAAQQATIIAARLGSGSKYNIMQAISLTSPPPSSFVSTAAIKSVPLTIIAKLIRTIISCRVKLPNAKTVPARSIM
ncbi:MAG: hypothetical protein RSC01_06925 [Oscillospiraceae bacterium]